MERIDMVCIPEAYVMHVLKRLFKKRKGMGLTFWVYETVYEKCGHRVIEYLDVIGHYGIDTPICPVCGKFNVCYSSRAIERIGRLDTERLISDIEKWLRRGYKVVLVDYTSEGDINVKIYGKAVVSKEIKTIEDIKKILN